jgi:transposase InsO family protein
VDVVEAEGWDINRKRVERLWRLEGHRVPPRRTQTSGKKAQGLAVNAIWNLTATRPNQIWSYDFMGSRLRHGTPFRVLNIVDEFTREALACRVDRSISSADVIAELVRLFAERGKLRIPTQSGHPFRFNPATCSDESGHPWRRRTRSPGVS